MVPRRDELQMDGAVAPEPVRQRHQEAVEDAMLLLQ